MSSRSVSIFLPALYGGGAEHTMLVLAREFAEQGYDVELVVAWSAGEFEDRVPAGVGYEVLGSPKLPGFELLGCLWDLKAYFQRREPDGVLSALTRTNIVSLWAGRLAAVDASFVVSERNHLSSHLEHADVKERWALPRLVEWTYPSADGIVGISDGVADDLAATANLPRDSIDVVYNPARPTDSQLNTIEPVDHPWFEAAEPVVLGVGSLTRQKDFPTLIRAVDEIQSERDCRLLILGEGQRRDELESLISDLGMTATVELPGFVDTPLAYMARADVFALSSTWEGFGNVVVEALACGCPVVSTDCPSGPGEILDGGTYGPLVPVGDHEALATAILDTLETPPNSETLRRRAAEFSPERSANGYLAALFG